jgi:hypothetical protein
VIDIEVFYYDDDDDGDYNDVTTEQMKWILRHYYKIFHPQMKDYGF